MDGHVPPANLNAAGPASWSDDAEHPSSAESDHSSASWWEKSPTPHHPHPLTHPPPPPPALPPRRFHDREQKPVLFAQNCSRSWCALAGPGWYPLLATRGRELGGAAAGGQERAGRQLRRDAIGPGRCLVHA